MTSPPGAHELIASMRLADDRPAFLERLYEIIRTPRYDATVRTQAWRMVFRLEALTRREQLRARS